MQPEFAIRYEPFKEIVIMEYTRFQTPDHLARFLSVAAGGKPTGVYWAEGVAFFYYPIAANTEAATKILIEQKTVYWAFVSYAVMPEYRPVIETKEKIEIDAVRDALAKADGVVVKDDFKNAVYPTALDSSGRDNVFVGRIREDISIENGINMWIVGDQLRKGAALNTIQIAEELIKGT